MINILLRTNITTTTDRLRTLWESRDQAFKRTTLDYQATQKRMLAFLAVDPFQKFHAFSLVASALGWKYATQAAYWTATMAAQTCLNIQVTTADRKNQRHLEHLAAVEMPALAPPMTIHHIHFLLQIMDDDVTTGIFLAYAWGQRLSDIAKIRVSRVFRWPKALAITFVDGKTIQYTGPFTMFLPMPSCLANRILQLYTKHRGWTVGTTLFTPDFHQQAATRLASMELEVRSVRRGGLQNLAALGLSPDQILKFSHHSSVTTLYRYLGYATAFDCNSMNEIMEKAVFDKLRQVGLNA
jgi:hypothetical protein